MTTHNTREGKPDFHMIALTKSECAKDAGELTVVRLGYVTQLLEELYATVHQELQKAREEERERIEVIFKKHVPPHPLSLEDSVWLKRLLNKAFNHNQNV